MVGNEEWQVLVEDWQSNPDETHSAIIGQTVPIWKNTIDSKTTETTLQEFSEKLENAVKHSTIED